MSSAPPLDYAPARPIRRLRRRIVVAGLLIAAILTWHYRQALFARARLLIAQYRCMNYAAPADQLIFETDDLRGDQLMARDRAHYQQGNIPLPYIGVSYKSTFRQIPPWEDLCALFQPQKMGYVAQSPTLGFTYGYGALRTPGDSGFKSIPIFLHQRQSSNGQSRLVVIDLDSQYRWISVRVIRPASLTGTPEVLWEDLSNEVTVLLKVAALYNDSGHLGVQFYAGQPDPADKSRFTINVTIAGVKIQLLGQLLSDDTVRIEIPRSELAEAQIIHNLDKRPAAPPPM